MDEGRGQGDSADTGELLLERGAMALRLAPGIGGCVTGLCWRGFEVLRRVSGAPASALDSAAYPLFPFFGRIPHGRFRFGGRQVQLRPNFAPEPHAIHGQAWCGAWRVASQDGQSAKLVFEHAGHDWPWAYRAEQRFRLLEDRLELALELCNLSSRDMPAGFGWHPFFSGAGALVEAAVDGVWRFGSRLEPTGLAPLEGRCDLRAPRPVAGLDLDHVFRWPGHRARICWPRTGLCAELLAATPLDHLVVFAPPERDFVCVEPVSHVANALNASLPGAESGLHVLAPGARLRGAIQLRVMLARSNGEGAP
ncbi:MAG: aldose 1-epimerase [Pseudomonadales bacterium]